MDKYVESYEKYLSNHEYIDYTVYRLLHRPSDWIYKIHKKYKPSSYNLLSMSTSKIFYIKSIIKNS